jgi:hypothetical protein
MAGPLIQPDFNNDASLYINKAAADPTPANDEGRVPILEDDGKLSPVFFGFDGIVLERDFSSAASTLTSVLFDNSAHVLYKNGLTHSISTNPERIIAVTKGWYEVFWGAGAVSSSSAWGCHLYKNGSVIYRASGYTNSTVLDRSPVARGSALVYLDVGDYLSIVAYSSTTATLPYMLHVRKIS